MTFQPCRPAKIQLLPYGRSPFCAYLFIPVLENLIFVCAYRFYLSDLQGSVMAGLRKFQLRECAGIPWAGVSGNVLLCKSYFSRPDSVFYGSSPVSPDAELPEWFEQSTRIASRDLTLQAVGKSGRAVAGLKLHQQPIRTAASPLAAPHRRKHFAAAVPYPSAC